jgi:hypothetical protein
MVFDGKMPTDPPQNTSTTGENSRRSLETSPSSAEIHLHLADALNCSLEHENMVDYPLD